MAQQNLDLTEDQIEQLLSAAEASLPDTSAASKPVRAKQPKSLAPAASAASATSAAQPANSSAGKDVTLRVPHPGSKEKKVCSPSRLVQFCPLLHDESKSQIRMTRRRAPVMGADPAPPMILICS